MIDTGAISTTTGTGTGAITTTTTIFANTGNGVSAIGLDAQSRAKVLVKLLNICHKLIATVPSNSNVPNTSDKKYAIHIYTHFLLYRRPKASTEAAKRLRRPPKASTDPIR
jgi:hypothetical protein